VDVKREEKEKEKEKKKNKRKKNIVNVLIVFFMNLLFFMMKLQRLKKNLIFDWIAVKNY
jgi:hypothetical protein